MTGALIEMGLLMTYKDYNVVIWGICFMLMAFSSEGPQAATGRGQSEEGMQSPEADAAEHLTCKELRHS